MFGCNARTQPLDQLCSTKMSLKEVAANPRGTFSSLQEIERSKTVILPKVLQSVNLSLDNKEALGAVDDHEEIQKLFPATYGKCRVELAQASDVGAVPRKPLKVAVVLSGGQASGGHNVIAGVFDFVKRVSPDSELFGFMDGPHGIYTGKYCRITADFMDQYRNTGGFDMIGSGRHKIESAAHFKASMDNCTTLDLDGLVVIGGDDSNTNAALLAEYFAANNCKTKVCGAPKTIDGDLKVHPYIPISFGFDTACRTYSELIGNLGQDTLSSHKYYHFVRLMGRAASNIALECALLTRPNICLISEEVQEKNLTLSKITRLVVKMIVQRAEAGKDYGIVLLPEGLIEFIPEFDALISEINDVLAAGTEASEEAVLKELSFNNRAVFSYLPGNIKSQLLLERDPHGNVMVTKIETEKLLAQTVEMELAQLAEQGKYKGSFQPQFHSFGYEGRSCLPSEFDATYCYALGQTVGAMLNLGCTGLISSVTNLQAPVSEWVCGGVPITMMCHMEHRSGHMKPVIKKALVDLNDLPFQVFAQQRADWAKYDLYRNPGPIQFSHSGSGVEDPSYRVELSVTLKLELLKQDPRMDPALTEPARAIQDAAPRYGHCYFAPLVGKSNCAMSEMQQQRAMFRPQLCPALQDKATLHDRCGIKQPTQCTNTWDKEGLLKHFPQTYGLPLVSVEAPTGEGNGEAMFHSARPHKLRRASIGSAMNVGVVFCGRQTPGGHDIIAGLFDALPTGSKLYGFVGGTLGLKAGHAVEITAEVLQNYRGQGGFDLLGRSVDKIKHNEAEHDAVAAVCKKLGLDGLVLMGGPRTSTDAAYLAEALLARRDVGTAVVTVPLIYNGSIRNAFVETTVGFDTATRTTAQIIGTSYV
jgi:pyrophosphate--fructose-6-phosphate 1-phosphotransferase